MHKYAYLIFGILGAATVVAFQNCSGGSLPQNAVSSSSATPAAAAAALAPCNLTDGSGNVSQVASGVTQQGVYSVSSVTSGTCPSSEQMTCSNGTWLATPIANQTGVATGAGSGSSTVNYLAAYASCAAPAGCTFNGQSYASGTTATAYSAARVAYGSACSSVQQTLTCANGTFVLPDGSSAAAYTQASCTVAAWVGKYQQTADTYSPANTSPSMPQCPQALGACTARGQQCYWMNYSASSWGGWWNGGANEWTSFICR